MTVFTVQCQNISECKSFSAFLIHAGKLRKPRKCTHENQFKEPVQRKLQNVSNSKSFLRAINVTKSSLHHLRVFKQRWSFLMCHSFRYFFANRREKTYFILIECIHLELLRKSWSSCLIKASLQFNKIHAVSGIYVTNLGLLVTWNLSWRVLPAGRGATWLLGQCNSSA